MKPFCLKAIFLNVVARVNSKAAQLTEDGQRSSVCSHGLRWEPLLYPLWLIVLAYGGHMEQRTYPGEISLIS